MPITTPIEQFCDQYWEDTDYDDFLECVAGKLAEEVYEQQGSTNDSDLVIISRVIAQASHELKAALEQRLIDDEPEY